MYACMYVCIDTSRHARTAMPRKNLSPAGIRRPRGRCLVASRCGRAATTPRPAAPPVRAHSSWAAEVRVKISILFSEGFAPFDYTPPCRVY